MKHATEHAKKLASLLKPLPSPQPLPLEGDSPLARLVMGFLQWNASERAAHAAFKKILAVMVDYNDLRVSRPSDIVALLGPRYPQVEERAARLRDTLQAIYVREHATSLESLRTRSAREARAYLESLPGITPYVVAYTLLWGLEHPALPVDDRLLELLKGKGVLEPDASVSDAAAFLERQVKNEEMRKVHLALQHWADHQEAGTGAGRKAAPAKSRASAPPKRRKTSSASKAKKKR